VSTRTPASSRAGTGRPGRRELIAVGALFGTILVVTIVTYSRIAPADLYHVSVDGPPGGLGRALVELNFPDSLIAIPLALLALDVLRTREAAVVTGVAIVLCLVTALPGVVDQGDLDAKAVNAIPALGVGLTVALLVAAFPRLGWAAPRLRGDPARVVIAAAIAVAMIPYVFAELGFYAPDPIMADEPTPWENIAAVHLGSHEGMDGALLALAVLAVTRLTPWFAGKRLAAVTSTLLAFLLSYGVANLIEDDWLEQVAKRGWTDHRIPSLVRPQLSFGWALIVLGAIAVELAWFRRERRAAARSGVAVGASAAAAGP
jgi:hypothetical protein